MRSLFDARYTATGVVIAYFLHNSVKSVALAHKSTRILLAILV